MNKKILIASPTSKHKDYCLNDFIIHTKMFTYSHDLFLVDNSEDPEYHKKILSYGVDCVHYNPAGQELKHVMSACNNIIRAKVLSGKYDFLISLETDQFPPINFIELLLSYDKDVISLPYFIYEGEQSRLLLSKLTKAGKTLTFEKIPPPEQAKYITGDSINTIGNNGIGCMLIKRHVLEKIKFKTNEEDVFADTHFHISLFRHGIENWLYTGAISTHRNSSWDLIDDLNYLNKTNQ